MQRQLNERTEKLNTVGDSMGKLEEHSSGFADEVGKFVSSQKKKVLLGSKFLLSSRCPWMLSLRWVWEFGVLIFWVGFIGIKGKWF
jgi:hypothetical protein